jgi:hypothetical protein
VSFHIVLRHKNAPQVAQIKWLDESRPAWITATPDIAMRCVDLQRENRPLRIHRMEWAGLGPAVCCECSVQAVREIDEHSYHVEFNAWRVLEIIPLVRPVRGQARYEI